MLPNAVPNVESPTTNIWLFAVTAVVSTVRDEAPAGIATKPAGDAAHDAAEAVDLQIVEVASKG